MAPQPRDNYQPIAKNNKAKFDYDIQETLEAGIVLQGTEVKSLRLNRASIAEGHIDIKDRNAYLLNVSILPYKFSKHQNHQPNRPRRILLHRRQIDKLASLIKQKSMTIVPLSFYFNSKGLAKLTIGIAKGKKLYDKRAVIKQREHDLEKRRAIKEFR